VEPGGELGPALTGRRGDPDLEPCTEDGQRGRCGRPQLVGVGEHRDRTPSAGRRAGIVGHGRLTDAGHPEVLELVEGLAAGQLGGASHDLR
jgi:hypothetical protein